jgi:hypothetical protein
MEDPFISLEKNEGTGLTFKELLFKYLRLSHSYPHV